MLANYCLRLDAVPVKDKDGNPVLDENGKQRIDSVPYVRPCIVAQVHRDGSADVVIFDPTWPGRECNPRTAAPRGGPSTPGWYPADGSTPAAPRARRR